MKWLERRVRAVRNRARRIRRSPIYDTFIAVYLALVALEVTRTLAYAFIW
jgi:hypothetical protein